MLTKEKKILAVWAGLVAFILPLLFHTETLIIFFSQSLSHELLIMVIFWVVLCGIPIFFLAILLLLYNRAATKIFLIVAAIVSLMCLKLTYLHLSPTIELLVALSMFAALYYVCIKKHYLEQLPSIMLLLVLAIIFIAVPSFFHIDILNAFQKKDVTSNNAEHSFHSIKDITFTDKPNVYILLFDSLLPPSIAKVFFGSDSAPYEKLFLKNLITPTGVSLQNEVASKASIRNIMWLDMPGALPGTYTYFNGEFNSPLSTIFKNNGYEITAGYPSFYWGAKGSYIDKFLTIENYLNSNLTLGDTTLCLGYEKSFRGFGVCRALKNFSSMPTPLQLISTDESPQKKIHWTNVIEHHIRLSPSRKKPQLSFFYTYTPIGHANTKTYDHSEKKDRDEYLKRWKKNAKLAELVISNLISAIRDADPNAIVLIAGDHGPWISRNGYRGHDPSFELVDRHSVAIGLLKTSNEYVKSIEQNGFQSNASGYHTISTVLLSVISYLAKRPNLVKELPVSTRFPSKIIGSSSEEFISLNLSPELLKTFPKQ